jgi:acetoin utilization deacetylase AcuC-like enzyme
MNATGLVHHPDYVKHDTGIGHPERPERISLIIRHLIETGLLDSPNIACFEPTPATIEDLKLVHTAEYIERVKQISGRGGMLTPDTPLRPGTYDFARLSAGGAILAGELTVEGGFCYFNNIAIMIEYLRKKFGMKRFMIIDWDVHHGNGTQDIFYEDPTVLYFSTHQMPLYPGTGYMEEIGEGEGSGYNVNLPLPAGTTGEVYDRILAELIIPLAEDFRPEIISVSSGFDAYFADPIASLGFTTNTYIRITKELMSLTERVCRGRLALVLEGGYDLEALPRILGCVISTMSELPINDSSDPYPSPSKKRSQEVEERIKKLKDTLGRYWNLE